MSWRSAARSSSFNPGSAISVLPLRRIGRDEARRRLSIEEYPDRHHADALAGRRFENSNSGVLAPECESCFSHVARSGNIEQKATEFFGTIPLKSVVKEECRLCLRRAVPLWQ